MKVTSYGAAGRVTGSCHLVETEQHTFLVDCGMYQGSKAEVRKNYEPFGFDPTNIDFLIVTHAHIDHCGLIPKLVSSGFAGTIYCSTPTADLLPIMLADSAHIQEQDTLHENMRRQRKGQPPRDPLYTQEDVQRVLPLIVAVDYEVECVVNVAGSENMAGTKESFILHDAGHIIGSSIIEYQAVVGNPNSVGTDFAGDSNPTDAVGTDFASSQASQSNPTDSANTTNIERIIFSGDLGQWDAPIIEDPTLLTKGDYVYIESTYGNSLHHSPTPRTEALGQIIQETYAAGGNLYIPCFALERTQEILFSMNKLIHQGKFPYNKVYLDSPLAIKATEVFRQNTHVFDEEAKAYDKPFDFPQLICSHTKEDSMAINKSKEPVIVIAGSGMCNAGRIRHHLKHGMWKPNNTLLFVGYQANGTLGRIILDGHKVVKMMGIEVAVKCRVERLESFSAHGDKDDLLRWLEGFEPKPKKVVLIHGEPETLGSFKKHLRYKGFSVAIAEDAVPIEL